MKQAALSVAAAIVLASGCKKDDADGQPAPAAQSPRDELNISYGNHSRQKMDVYLPAGYGTGTPVVFLLHGGGFVAGSKEEFTRQALLFRDQQFITVNLSYRLVDTAGLLSHPPQRRASEVTIATQLADLEAAIGRYRELAADWGSGTEKMYLAGHSAGAIISLLYTQGPQNNDGHIRAAGNWAGVTDFSLPHDSLLQGVDKRWLELMHRAVGAEMKVANNLAYMARSPFWQAYNEGGRPAITIYPENNALMGTGSSQLSNDYNLLQTRKFHQLLSDRGIANQLTIIPGEGHGFSNKPDSWSKTVAETAAWFKSL